MTDPTPDATSGPRPDEADRLAERMVWMDAGIVQVGTSDRAIACPASKSSAEDEWLERMRCTVAAMIREIRGQQPAADGKG